MEEAVIKQIIEQVMKELQGHGTADTGYTDGMKRLLVVGDPAAVPEDMADMYAVWSMEDYVHYGNIQRYDRILITELSLTQLSDIAQGRDGSPEASAVITALLSGIEVCMLEKALPHRQYAGRTSSRLYEVIENNARLIQTFGVRLLRKTVPAAPAPAKPAKFQAPPVAVPKGSACPNSERLITETVAKALTANGEKSICLAKDAIITPSAWDVFHQQKAAVIRK